MNRITEIEIAGTKMYLNFSVAATEIISEEHESIENWFEKLQAANTMETLSMLVDVLAILAEQGAEYRRITKREEVATYTADELKVLIGLADLGGLQDKILEAIGLGASTTVEVEPGKNAKTAQDK